ncbi:hypothetical protein ACP3V3_01855 [Vibrio sp. PNB22_3_1]
MANYCNNALEVDSTSEAAQAIVNSLFDGTYVNRTDEIIQKLQKIALAGMSGLLHPHSDTPVEVLTASHELNPNLVSATPRNDDKCLAYSEFLHKLNIGTLSFESYDTLNKLFERTGLGNLWWGDIPRHQRMKIKAHFNRCRYDFAKSAQHYNIEKWWSQPNKPKNESEAGILDIRAISELPIKSLINGFNGHLLNTGSNYQLLLHIMNTKTYKIDVEPLENGNWYFSTAWSPAKGLIEAIPLYVGKKLGMSVEMISENPPAEVNLYFYEPGNAFQGINDESWSYTETYDEETDEFHSNLDDDILNAFDEYA